jgi:ribonucleoside-diphosphate reductase alpha chain
MHTSGHGEPGIFSRRAAHNTIPERRLKKDFGTNPCGEIVSTPISILHLSIAVARSDDTYETLKEKVELATIIGTIQAMATNFPGLRDVWKNNCEEERLLGVGYQRSTGSLIAQDPEVQSRLREVAVETNRVYAELLGINQAAAVTCVKPSGNSSQLLDCSPGLHPRWSKYYVRNVRVATHSPIFKVLRDAGVPMHPENGQTIENATTWVVHFPVKSPDNPITRDTRPALVQCEYWLQSKIHWTEHNPSVTITYNPDEIIDIIKWVWEHQDRIGGMTFLPSMIRNSIRCPTKCSMKKSTTGLPSASPTLISRNCITMKKKI